MDRTPAEAIAAVRLCVSSKRNARGLVEELRAVSLISWPAPPLFSSLLGALQALKANRKAGEENKAIRACYQYISWLANSSLLDSGAAMAVLHQLSSIDMRDELVPRQLAAAQLFAEIAGLYPSACGECAARGAADGAGGAGR